MNDSHESDSKPLHVYMHRYTNATNYAWFDKQANSCVGSYLKHDKNYPSGGMTTMQPLSAQKLGHTTSGATTARFVKCIFAGWVMV